MAPCTKAPAEKNTKLEEIRQAFLPAPGHYFCNRLPAFSGTGRRLTMISDILLQKPYCYRIGRIPGPYLTKLIFQLLNFTVTHNLGNNTCSTNNQIFVISLMLGNHLRTYS